VEGAEGVMLRDLLDRLRSTLASAVTGEPLVQRTVLGLAVVVNNTRPDIATEHVLARLEEALGLIRQYQPWHFRRFARDFAFILVKRYPCRGAFLTEQRICLVELTFTVNPEFTAAQVASTILHEAMHARLHAAKVQYTPDCAARHERFCRRAEIEFGRMVPGGEAIVERALASLESPDEDVAPAIDWELAAERVRAVDQASAPERPKPT
jgi:hypothetical protein